MRMNLECLERSLIKRTQNRVNGYAGKAVQVRSCAILKLKQNGKMHLQEAPRTITLNFNQTR